MDIYEYIDFVKKSRGKADGISAFAALVTPIDVFNQLVDGILAVTTSWAETIGHKEEEPTTSLTKQEKKWEQFFRDHSFDSMEQRRNFADAFSIVEDIELSRFIKTNSVSKPTLPAYLCIIPTSSGSNGHSYKIGSTILSLIHGTQFYTIQGSIGNNMTTNPAEYRVATREEIAVFLPYLMYRLSSATEHLVAGLLNP